MPQSGTETTAESSLLVRHDLILHARALVYQQREGDQLLGNEDPRIPEYGVLTLDPSTLQYRVTGELPSVERKKYYQKNEVNTVPRKEMR